MVLTNFECWAHSGNVGGGLGINSDIESQLGGGVGVGGVIAASRQMDPFNPRVVQQTMGTPPQLQPSTDTAMESQTVPNSVISHIPSNGYYGFSYVNAAHELNNNDMLNNNNNMTCNNNNNKDDNDIVDTPAAAANRCKKRFFVNDAADGVFLIANKIEADNTNHGHHVAAKRCRFDDDFSTQYFNDFFNMQTANTTQIGTQSCLMDTEDSSELTLQAQEQQKQLLTSNDMKLVQQQQVDVAMTATAEHIPNNTPNNDLRSSVPIESNNKINNMKTMYINSNKHMQKLNENNHFNKTSELKTEIIKSLNVCNNAIASSHLTRGAYTACSNGSSSCGVSNICKLELLFAATHGGSQYHYSQYCNSTSNCSNRNCNNNFYRKTQESKADEDFFEEF